MTGATERLDSDEVIEVGGDTAEHPVDVGNEEGSNTEAELTPAGSEKVKAGRESAGKLKPDDTVVGEQILAEIDTVDVDNVVIDDEEDTEVSGVNGSARTFKEYSSLASSDITSGGLSKARVFVGGR